MDHDDGMDWSTGPEPGHDPSIHDPSVHDPSGHDPSLHDPAHDPALAEADTADLTGAHPVAGPPEDDFGFDDADSYGPHAGHGHDHGLPDEKDLAHGHEGSEGDLDADLAAGLDHHDAHPAPGSTIDAPDDDEEEPRHDDSHLDEAPDQSHLFADADTPVGADPDVDHIADDPSWHDEPFPPVLDLGPPPEPVTGSRGRTRTPSATTMPWPPTCTRRKPHPPTTCWPTTGWTPRRRVPTRGRP